MADVPLAWNNKVWHVYEAVSFDMAEGSSMLEKANRWSGALRVLWTARNHFASTCCLANQVDGRLRAEFLKARNILNKMPGEKAFVRESEADAFAEELAGEFGVHKQ